MSLETMTSDLEEGETLIQVRGLKKHFRVGTGLRSDGAVKAVDGVSFDIKKGETLGLVGESGCGKTTLGRLLIQLDRPTDGDIMYDGRNVTTLTGSDLEAWQRNSQMVFQDPQSSLNDRMTVGEIVREPLDVHGWPDLGVRVEAGGRETRVTGRQVMPAEESANVASIVVVIEGDQVGVSVRDELPLTVDDLDVTATEDDGVLTVGVDVQKSKPQIRRQWVRYLLDIVGLMPQHYYRYPHQFSGGQRQRIGVARALALEPEFVVLDEPVSALDVSVQAQVLNLLDDLQDEFGLTYLFIAHDLSVVRYICDRVAVMYLGHVMELGETEEIFQNPANPYTISLLSAIPEPDPESEKDRITLRGTPPSPQFPPEGCPFSTRCPMKIRPDKYEDLDDEVWEAVEVFREVIRERQRTDKTWREIMRETLGMETRFSDIDEIIGDVFGHLDVPPEVQDHVDEAADHIADGNESAAQEYLYEEFKSECDAEPPEFATVSEAGRQSLCHRHEGDVEDPRSLVTQTLLDDRERE